MKRKTGHETLDSYHELNRNECGSVVSHYWVVVDFREFVAKSLSPIGGLLALALMIVSLMIATALKIFIIESGIEEN